MHGENLLAQLRAAPAETALVFDVDGTLAPIVDRPQDAAVPAEVRTEVERLAARYRLVAGLSGREGEDARRLIGVAGVEVVGNHGLELDPEAQAGRPALERFRDAVDLPVEDKGLTLSYHYRTAPDPDAARARLEAVAAQACEAGLVPRFGRMVLEIRPPVRADKGTALRALLAGAGVRMGLYAGDDATDLDAFRGLAEAGLDFAVRVAVASEESPEALVAEADIVVRSPAEVLELLRIL